LRALDGKLTGGGLTTVMGKLPKPAISVAEIRAVNVVELVNVVGWATPFQLTTAPLAKPVPLTVNVKAGSPATAVSGARFVTDGVTVTLLAFEVSVVGVEFWTVMGKIPTLA
jgi:hypothetical protein